MSDLTVSLILRLVDKATAPWRATMDRMDRATRGAFSRNAAVMNRGARLMASGLGDVARGAGRAGMAVAAYHGVMAGIGAAFIRPAAEMERFKVQLTNLEGSSAAAERAMAWIQDFATRTPLELNDTIAAYAKLKAFGLDPTQGSLQALVDTMAASGGGAEQLDGLVLALGQSWTKGKLQGEEALQMLERGVPVWDLLAEKLGRTSAEVQEMATKGKLGRAEITQLIDALAARNLGASDKMSKTWDGIISNLIDHWSRWQVMVMDAGVFKYMKDGLQQLLDLLNAAAADGRLQRWAEQTAAAVIKALEGVWSLGVAAVEMWTQLYPWLEAAANWLGGWKELIIAITALGFTKTIIGMAVGIGKLVSVLSLVVRALMGFARGAVLLNPVGAAIAAIAVAAYAIYDSWDGIVGFFSAKIDRVRAAFDRGLLQGVFQVIKEFNGLTLIMEAAMGFVSWCNDKLREAFGIDLMAEGKALIQSLWAGVSVALGAMVDAIQATIRGAFNVQNGAIGKYAGTSAGMTATTPAQADYPFSPSFGLGKTQAERDRYRTMGTPQGGRATGGPVRAGQIYRWMEEGEERFMPRTDGLVISNRELRAMRAPRQSLGPQGISIGGITINAAPGMNPRDVAREVRRELTRVTRDGRALLHDGGAYAD